MTTEQLETVVRERICSVCSDRTVEGECGREEPSSCALFRLFPEVAKAITNTQSDDIRDYVEAIRHGVCSVCRSEWADGSCDNRAQVQCALDAYLMLVVDAIEEATGRQFDRALLTQPAPVTIQLAADR